MDNSAVGTSPGAPAGKKPAHAYFHVFLTYTAGLYTLNKVLQPVLDGSVESSEPAMQDMHQEESTNVHDLFEAMYPAMLDGVEGGTSRELEWREYTDALQYLYDRQLVIFQVEDGDIREMLVGADVVDLRGM